MDAGDDSSDAAAVNPTPTEEALRRHLRSHRWSVFAASGMALAFSVIGWMLLYGAAYWMAIFSIVVFRGMEGQPPASFHWAFMACAGVLMVTATADRILFPHERAVDERPRLEHLLDVLLFIPRLTLVVCENLSALATLKGAEWGHGAGLLDGIRVEGKVSLQELPSQIPDARSRARIVLALRLTQLIESKRADGLTWLYLSPLAPEEFHPRLFGGGPEHDFPAEMRHANAPGRQRVLGEPVREWTGGGHVPGGGEDESAGS